MALMRALSVSVDASQLTLTERSDTEGNVSRSMKVRVPRRDMDRLVGILRKFIWEGEPMVVKLSRVAHYPALAAPGPMQNEGRTTGRSIVRSSWKRAHDHAATPPRLNKLKIDEAASASRDLEDADGSGRLATIFEDEHASRSDSLTGRQFQPGDIVRAPRYGADGSLGADETLKLTSYHGSSWSATRMDFVGAKIRYRPVDARNSEGWLATPSEAIQGVAVVWRGAPWRSGEGRSAKVQAGMGCS